MNWYKRLKFAQISGEFWIDGDGNVMKAEYGDYNHEAYVRQYILSSYDMDWEGSGVDIEEPKFLEDFVTEEFEETVEYLFNRQEITEQQKNKMLVEGLADPDNHETVVSYLTVGDVMRIRGATEDEIDVIDGGDARAFAMKQWGWKRLEGHHVESWTLSHDDMDTIASGLFDAYGENAEGQDFVIHVYSTGQTADMTYEELSSAKQPQRGGLTGTEQEAYQRAVQQQDQGHPYYKGHQGD